MSFTEVIKRSKTIRRIGKSLKIYKEFLNDAHGFSSSYIEAAEEKENYKYADFGQPARSVSQRQLSPRLHPERADLL